MNEDFRADADRQFNELTSTWREIERWLKKAEQVNQAAVIPAINELRYASRQMINASVKLRQQEITDADKSIIRKRLIIAEQYLFNADHDISDSITTFYGGIMHVLDDEIGQSIICQYYPGYYLMKEKLRECSELISDARQNYDNRKENYGKIKADHLPFLISSYGHLRDAEVSARHQKAQTDGEITRARATIDILAKLTIAGFLFGILAIFLSVYLWAVSREEYCKSHGSTPIMNVVCPAAPLPVSSTPAPVKTRP